jgi:hypothetical protein
MLPAITVSLRMQDVRFREFVGKTLEDFVVDLLFVRVQYRVGAVNADTGAVLYEQHLNITVIFSDTDM